MAAVMGPIVDTIGNYFFSCAWASKTIPERLRPRFALERFGPYDVILNDMSAFECSISHDIINLIELRVFRHFYPACTPWINKYLSDIHISKNGVKTVLPCSRRSGDPQTSLGNSLTNLASILAAFFYVNEQLGINVLPTMWVEGDDSLVAWPEEWGQPSLYNDAFETYHNAFQKMGFATKMEISPFVGRAGYCSMYFDERGHNSPSVTHTLLEFPWDHNNSNQAESLLAMKAQSIMAQAPGQPITWALASRYAARRAYRVRLPYNDYLFEEYKREGFHVVPGRGDMIITIPPNVGPVEPDAQDRQLFAQRYGVQPDEQREAERMIMRYGISYMPRTTLMKLAEVDGVDLAACRKYFRRYYDAEPNVVFEENKATHVLKAEGGRMTLEALKAPVIPAHLQQVPFEPIDPVKEAATERIKREYHLIQACSQPDIVAYHIAIFFWYLTHAHWLVRDWIWYLYATTGYLIRRALYYVAYWPRILMDYWLDELDQYRDYVVSVFAVPFRFVESILYFITRLPGAIFYNLRLQLGGILATLLFVVIIGASIALLVAIAAAHVDMVMTLVAPLLGPDRA